LKKETAVALAAFCPSQHEPAFAEKQVDCSTSIEERQVKANTNEQKSKSSIGNSMVPFRSSGGSEGATGQDPYRASNAI